jgi:carboxyl-terminal processing protease
MPRKNLFWLWTLFLLSTVCYLRAERARSNRLISTLAQAMHEVDQNYLEPVDPHELFEGAMNGMLEKLDPYTVYIDPSQAEEFQEELDPKFGGIGIEVTFDAEAQEVVVVSPLANTPAYRAGIQAGDRLISVDRVPIEVTRLQELVSRLRGEPGTHVLVGVRRAGKEELLEFDLIREVVNIQSVLGDTHNPDGTWNFLLDESEGIALIRLISFNEDSTQELEEALVWLRERGMKALILDLRTNPGGLLEAGVETCNLFIREGRIVSTKDRHLNEKMVFDATGDGEWLGFPMAVLVNGYSASASEIVAACLQDHGRAVIVGERTFGKGTVQDVLPLEQGRSYLKLTTASFWRPSGRNIHRMKDADDSDDWGIRPDAGMEVVLTDEQRLAIAEARRERDVVRPAGQDAPPNGAQPPDTIDPQLARALEAVRAKLARPAVLGEL